MKHFTNQNTYEHVCSLHGIGIQINSAVYIKREKFTIFPRKSHFYWFKFRFYLST